MMAHAKWASGITLGLLYCVLGAIVLLVPVALATEAASENASDDAAPAISVGRMLFCRSIKEREPQETGKAFPNDIEKVYCFTVIVNAGPEATHVIHKWYWGKKLMGSVRLKAQGEHWRTWSLKHMQPEWTGTWRVDVVSAQGKVLKSTSFELVAGGASADEVPEDADEVSEDAEEASEDDVDGEGDSGEETGESDPSETGNGGSEDSE